VARVSSDPKPSLTVVLPVFNGAGWIGRSLHALDAAIVRGGFSATEILVVDDGSTDATVAEVRAAELVTPVRVLQQPNRGRFLARRRGLDEATGDYLLFIDTRVFLHPDAFAFVVPHLADDRSQVWTADVRAVTEGNPIARFWKCIEHVAWRRYHNDRRHVRYGLDEFDFYPKGTTALLCPTALMRAAYDAFAPTVADPTKINDDTALLRYVAERTPINIAPEYGCDYHARSTLKAFLKHANHRGSVLIDGYLHPGVRFANAIKAVLALTPVGVVVALRHPKLAVAGAAAGAVGAGAVAKSKGAETADAAVLAGLSIPFGVAYLAGMWRGALSRVAHLRGGSPSIGATT
jgi:glycosyltransferase involved in cell wall biosynthesis